MSIAPRGHIKLARKAFDPSHGDPFWLEPRTFSKWEAWVDLIQTAAWRARDVSTKTGVVRLERGELLLSVRHAAKRWGWSKSTTESYLRSVAKSGRLIGRSAGRSGTVYLIVNYDAYQAGDASSRTVDQPEERTQTGRKPDKKEAVKQEEPLVARRGRRVPTSDPEGDPRFPGAHYDRLQGEWESLFGPVPPGQFRKGLKACFLAGIRPGQLVRAFREYRDDTANRIKKFAWFLENVQRWVQQGDSCVLEHAPCEVFGLDPDEAELQIAAHRDRLAAQDAVEWETLAPAGRAA